jgi:hypothetical protein
VILNSLFYVIKEENIMKKLTILALIFVLLTTLSPTYVLAYDERDADGFLIFTPEQDDLRTSPNVKPGDYLRAGMPSAGHIWGYDYDQADIGVSTFKNHLEKIKRHDAIIIGDMLVFTEYAITFSDGTVIEGTREIFPDGEHVSIIFPDNTPPPRNQS